MRNEAAWLTKQYMLCFAVETLVWKLGFWPSADSKLLMDWAMVGAFMFMQHSSKQDLQINKFMYISGSLTFINIHRYSIHLWTEKVVGNLGEISVVLPCNFSEWTFIEQNEVMKSHQDFLSKKISHKWHKKDI